MLFQASTSEIERIRETASNLEKIAKEMEVRIAAATRAVFTEVGKNGVKYLDNLDQSFTDELIDAERSILEEDLGFCL